MMRVRGGGGGLSQTQLFFVFLFLFHVHGRACTKCVCVDVDLGRIAKSLSDSRGTEASMDQTAELQLAAEMGQLLISQKRELMQELEVIKGKNTGTF
jgi:hypothetical protein